MGVALSFLMSYGGPSAIARGGGYCGIEDLLERLVIDKTGGIFWNIQLPFLDVFPKLPEETCRVSMIPLCSSLDAQLS